MLGNKIVACDVDGPILDFYSRFIELNGLDYKMLDSWELDMNWDVVSTDIRYWSNLSPVITADDVPFEIDYFITSCPVWYKTSRYIDLLSAGFDIPIDRMIISNNKLKDCKKLGIDIMIDDKPDTVKILNDNGIKCYQLYPPYANWEVISNDLLIRNVGDVLTKYTLPTFEQYGMGT